MEKVRNEMHKIMEQSKIKCLFILILPFLFSSCSSEAQEINVIISINEKDNLYKVKLIDSKKTYNPKVPYVVSSGEENSYVLKYNNKDYYLNNSKLIEKYQTIYMLLSNDSNTEGYILYKMNNNISTSKESFVLNYNSCFDQLYLINKRLTSYKPKEKFTFDNCD